MGKILLVCIFWVSSFLFVSSNPITDSIIIPCKKNDVACMTKSANVIIPLIAAGIPKLNVKPIDPMYPGQLEGELPNLIYKLKDNVIYGYGKCDISNLELNWDAMKLNFDLNCPLLILEGYYEVSGEIIEGKGTYKLVFGKYGFGVNTDIQKVKSDDGESHMNIKAFEVTGRKLAPVKLEYTNDLLNGNSASEEEEKLYYNKMMKLVGLLKHAYILAIFNSMFENVNVLLQTVTFDELFIN